MQTFETHIPKIIKHFSVNLSGDLNAKEKNKDMFTSTWDKLLCGQVLKCNKRFNVNMTLLFLGYSN